ncbi:RidA family protein [Nocardioides luteus]|jgi:2-iminobutanoate/2-iminopropanoate deaminase|uniref:RidA family protein n=1 Tax=Nocardioides luteus TaxID=1844 RepID=UPI00135B5070|nr:RidA family protein [Nocardioides luteus]MBG6096830.1 reactive intermediate/imine deaminase [Nocardioides luteus]
MSKTNVVSPALATPNGHFSQASTIEASGKLVFVSGMTARNNEGGITGIGNITEQTHQVCQNLKAAVEAAGGTLDDICRVDVYVRNMEDFQAIHEVRRQYFTGEPPASTMVEVSKFVSKDYLIEINAIAVVQEQAS